MELLKQHIEALIFCSEQSISPDEIAASLKISFDWDLTDEDLQNAIDEIRTKYSADEFPFELAEVSGGYQFLTKKQFFNTVSALIQHKAKKKLSVSQMETLAIIAYRQPVTKAEVEHIRGVSCDYAIQKLLEKELVEISGKSEGPGRPVVYSTSRTFMDYFGIKSVKDLPQLKDLHVEQNEIGPAGELAEETSYQEMTIVHPSGDMESGETDVPVTEEALNQIETNTVAESSEGNVSNEEEIAVPDLVSDAETEVTEIEAETTQEQVEEIPSDLIDKQEEIITDLPDRKSIYLGNEKVDDEELAGDSQGDSGN